MPMNFLDKKSLKFAAKIHKFRGVNIGESEDEYRSAIADHVEPIDFIESCEIRYKVGWDQWTVEQTKDMLKRSGALAR